MALTDPQSGEMHGFASLEALTAFLQATMEAANSPEVGDQTASPDSISGEGTPIPFQL
jgi:hypothetical protein